MEARTPSSPPPFPKYESAHAPPKKKSEATTSRGPASPFERVPGRSASLAMAAQSTALRADLDAGYALGRMKIESLDHIHIYSEDAERSAAFYREHFDAQEVL